MTTQRKSTNIETDSSHTVRMDLSVKSNPKTRAASGGGGGDGGRGGNHANKRRAQISIMEKVRIIERFRSGESASSIATSCGIGQSTVCEITQAEAEIMETLRTGDQSIARRTIRCPGRIMDALNIRFDNG